MKPLHFLENAYKCPGSDECILYSKEHLENMGIPNEYINSMEIHYQYQLLPREEILNLLFDKTKIMVSYSVYTRGSDSQVIKFLSLAGIYEIKNQVYIDSSGQLVDFLNRTLRDNKRVPDAFALISGVNCNTILTRVGYKTVMQIKIHIGEYYENPVVLEEFDITTIL